MIILTKCLLQYEYHFINLKLRQLGHRQRLRVHQFMTVNVPTLNTYRHTRCKEVVTGMV